MSEPRPALLDSLLSGAISGCHCSCLIHEGADQGGGSLAALGAKGPPAFSHRQVPRAPLGIVRYEQEGREHVKGCGRVGGVQAAVGQSALRAHVHTSCFLLS